MRILAIWVRWREIEIPDVPFKGPAHKLFHLQIHTLGTDRGTEAEEAQESYRERLHCMAQE